MKYIKYKIRNVEPLRIADDSTSQRGQSTSLRYIPGTTIRGYIINQLSETFAEKFKQYKGAFISEQVVYLNAYLNENGKALVPSPKGFYEDKTVVEGKKRIENVVTNGTFHDGFKRAGLGRYCYFENDCVYYYNVETGSDLKNPINCGDRDIFRNEYIAAGCEFVGYILVKDDSLVKEISSVLSGTIVLGNAKSQGMGKCKVLAVEELEDDDIPYNEYAVKKDAENTCYMMLLSNTVMRNEYGEFTGLNLKELETKLGVSNLQIKYCSTATVNVKGYNRTWRSKIPSMMMYEQGSVFKFVYEGTASLQRMYHIMKMGIGVRISEGFGRVLFLENYEKYKYKLEGQVSGDIFASVIKKKGDEHNLELIACNYYRRMIKQKMQNRILDKAEQLKFPNGNIRSLLESYRYNAIEGTKVIKEYISHQLYKQSEQKIQVKKDNSNNVIDMILTILDQPLAKTLEIENVKSIMGYPVDGMISEAELQRMKFDYIINLMRYDNRKGQNKWQG